MLGDKVAIRMPYHGRLILAQFGALLVFLLSYIFYTSIIYSNPSFTHILILMAFISLPSGLVLSSPLLSDVVTLPMRSQAFSFYRFIQLIVFSVSPIICGGIAEHYFGYAVMKEGASAALAVQSQNAHALAQAMRIVSLSAFGCIFCIYSLLHFTYPKDKLIHHVD
jgi:hypothetical protein